MNITPATEIVNTLELAEGDIVWNYGMRILLSQRGEAASGIEGLADPRVVWFHGEVLNADELGDDDAASLGLRTDSRCTTCKPGQHWNVQGNERATWAREVSA